MIFRTGTMRRVFLKIILPFLGAVIFTGCTANIRDYKNLTVITKGEIDLEEKDIRKLIKAPINEKRGSGTIEIIIYSYSSGAEIIEYSDKDGFRQHETEGRMSAMIKLKRSGKVSAVQFTSARGKNNREIIQKLSEKINRILNGG